MVQISSKTKVLKERLAALQHQEEEKRAKDLATQFNLPYADLSITPIETESLEFLPEKKAREAKVAIIKKRAKQILIAVSDPKDSSTKKIINELKDADWQIKLFMVSRRSLEKAWQIYENIAPEAKEITNRIEITPESFKKFQEKIKNLIDVKQQIENTPTTQISLIIEIILAGSLQINASDLHLETNENNVNLRYRIDGVLQDAVFLSPKTYHLILNKIKLLAGLKLNVHDAAQDGRFTISVNNNDIEVRVSCLPSAYGENIVMRVLNPKMINLSLEDLGFRSEILEIIKKEIKKPNGLIITTGPTGSGKTTALYSFLKTVNHPEIKIITLEDPIEYHLEGITQTQVEKEKGYTFANGLRAILRQDPDMVLIGEIRDKETAEIAIQASLTGHLVFSTLHTNDAAGAVPRFVELGAKAPTLASSLNLILAQRLIRKLCLKCRETATLSNEQLIEIKKALSGIEFEIKEIYQAKGCQECDQTGYKGRVGVFEIILIDEEMEKLIGSSPSHIQISDLNHKKGMFTIYQDALLKVIEGITTIEEVKRVIG